MAFLVGCGAPDPFEQYFEEHPTTEYKIAMEVPCFPAVYSEYYVSTHDVVNNLKLTRTILDAHGIVPADRFCDRFFNAYLVIRKTEVIDETETANVYGTFDGEKITVGNTMRALLHEEEHYIDFLARKPDWMEHNWSDAYKAAEADYEAQKGRVCFKLDGDIVCRIINVTVK